MLEPQISEFLFDRCRVDPGQRVLIGFSGGADSLCLLHLLKSQPVEVIAAHFDHNLRSESAEDAARCRAIAEDWEVAFVQEVGKVREFASERKLSIEEAARILRYRFLFEMARAYRADAVAVAHHADDQVETVLMHLLRGAGSSGLAGMRYRARDPLGESAIPLIRPLLAVWRSEIKEYCQFHHLTPLEDVTNADPAYFRNRIRSELIPQLETYNAEFKRHLWQTASILAEEDSQLDAEVDVLVGQIQLRSGDGWMLVDTTEFQDKALWFLRRLVRKIIFKLKSTLRDVSFAEVERAAQYMLHPDFNKTCQATDEIEVLKYDGRSVLVTARVGPLFDLWPQVITADMGDLAPGSRELQGGWKLTLQRLESSRYDTATPDPWVCLLDEDKVVQPLQLATRAPGDVFMPFGMHGKSIKIGDFFTNEHLPTRARDAWPLVRSQSKIVWVPGYRPAEFCKVTQETRRVLRMELTQKNK